MRVPRANIMAALVALIKKSTFNFTTVSEHYQSWDSQDTTSWPVAYIKAPAEAVSRQMYGTSKYHLHYRVFCYALVSSADPNFNLYSQVVGPLLDSIDAVLKPAMEGAPVNLGLAGVDDTFVEGTTLIADGVEDGRAVVVVPITVSVAG